MGITFEHLGNCKKKFFKFLCFFPVAPSTFAKKPPSKKFFFFFSKKAYFWPYCVVRTKKLRKNTNLKHLYEKQTVNQRKEGTKTKFSSGKTGLKMHLQRNRSYCCLCKSGLKFHGFQCSHGVHSEPNTSQSRVFARSFHW